MAQNKPNPKTGAAALAAAARPKKPQTSAPAPKRLCECHSRQAFLAKIESWHSEIAEVSERVKREINPYSPFAMAYDRVCQSLEFLADLATARAHAGIPGEPFEEGD